MMLQTITKTNLRAPLHIKLIILAVLSYWQYSSAQNSNFVTYGIDEGLIMSQIETVIEDPKGYLWIGTIGGLSKYDGIKFKNYTNKDGLAEDWITCSALDHKGNVWFGHWGGGVSMHLAKSDSFVDLKLEKTSNFKYINTILEVNQQYVYIGTEGAGLFRFNTASNTPEKMDIKLSGNEIKSIEKDAFNNLWISTENGIDIISSENNKIINTFSSIQGYSVAKINKIIYAYNNECWLASGNEGVLRVKFDKSYQIISADALNKMDGLTSNNIKTLYKDKLQKVWIGTKDQGVIEFIPELKNPSKNTITEGELNIFSNKFELKYYHANCFLEDREGNIWIGTEIGLNKYMGDLFRIYNHNDNLINNLVWSILEDKNGSMWFGTSQGISVFSFPKIKGKLQYNNPSVYQINSSNGLSENIIISLFQDSKGRIWAGTENNGINVLDNNKVVKKIGLPEGLKDGKIFSIQQDKDGYIWAGTRKGAAKIHPENFTVTLYTSSDGLGGDKVYHIFKDSKQHIWFGILGGYLTKYENNSFKIFDENSGLESKFILSMTEDKNGSIWLSTYGDGIIQYSNGTFTTYNSTHGLSSNSTHFITTDHSNNVWIGQSIGLEKFDQEKKKFSLYGKMQGFNGLETNENAIYKDSQGNIWFGTLRGAIKFDPKKDKINRIEPMTYIEKISVFYQNVPLNDNLTLSYKENYLTFDVVGISLTNPKEVRYKYYLEGLDKEWSPEIKQNKIIFSNLPHGKYVFHLKAINNSGIENSQPISFSFSITPPFWKTYWFYAICILLIVALVIIYIKQRERKLKERQQYLETEVAKRTEELKKEKEVVEQQNIEITKKNENIMESISYAKRIQEAILPPMDLIQKALPESFILYKPKDIVSGDFYWLHETSDKIIFAAVDCTGHGVPGAFMSIIGNNLLDKVVKEQGITKPSEILTQLSLHIIKTLRQDESKEVKDGMDIAICAIHKNSNKLEFSGAYNPLYLVRNGELIELKSDKIPIGKGHQNSNVQFMNQEYELKSSDMLYIFSDGYADQKGGPQQKKFYYPPFRQLLVDIHTLPMQKQREMLDKKITEWKGELEQYDDMLIFGVKINS